MGQVHAPLFSEQQEWRPEHYRDGILGHELATEHERLRVLESVLDPYTTAKLADLGVRSGWRRLEIGAGAGSIARWMAQRGATVIVARGMAADHMFDLTFEELANPAFQGKSLAGFTVSGRRV